MASCTGCGNESPAGARFCNSCGASLALALYEQGRYEEAESFVDISRSSGASDDVITQVYWRRGFAKILARRGRGDEALDLANEAVARMEPTDALNDHADALVDLAEVLRLLGRDRDAINPLERALALYERKENLVSASRVRERLASRAVLPGSE